jgi:ribosomal protein L31
MDCCHVLCCALSVPPQVYFHVIHVSSQVTKFENVDAETLAFLWYVLFENHPAFEGNNKFVNSQIFGRVVKFGKCAIQNFKQVSY